MNPRVVLSNANEQCVTFVWSQTPNVYLGYRFVEGVPTIRDTPVLGYERQPTADWSDMPHIANETLLLSREDYWKANWLTFYDDRNAEVPVRLFFRTFADGSAWCACLEHRQRQEFYFQPVADGIKIWLRLTTFETLTGSYCLQQCLRFSGRMNAPWRQAVAHVPFLSELDMQAMGNANGTLTSARREHRWFNFPVQHVVYPTQVALPLMSAVSPEGVDHGLIVRETPDRKLAPPEHWDHVAPEATWEQITSGLYWERTAYISNRHPADCVHVGVDFGPLETGHSRTLRGKVYFIEGSKDDLLALWQRDFPGAG